MEITDMESHLDRRIRILDEQLAAKRAKADAQAAQANGANYLPPTTVTDGADLPTAPNNYDVQAVWPFPHT